MRRSLAVWSPYGPGSEHPSAGYGELDHAGYGSHLPVQEVTSLAP